MGRPAKSEHENWLQGTVSQVKPPSPSQFKGGRPAIPKHLSPVGRTEFKRCIRLLEARRTVTPADEVIVAVHSEIYARWVQAKREIGDQLMVTTTVTDNNGNLRTVTRLNPLLKVVQACESRMLALTKSLGLTPDSREKTKPMQPQQESQEIVEGSVNWIIEQHLADKKRIDNDNLPA